MAIKPNINKIGAAPDYSSMTLDELRAEVKRRAEEKMAQEAAQRQTEEAERIRQQRNAEKIAGMANGMTESAQNAVQSAGRYASGWTNADAPVDAITSAQRNADTLSDYASLFSGELNRTFGSGAASDIYDAAKSTSGYLSDVRSGVRAQRDLYNQYENADDYNADQRLFSMSSEELKKEIEREKSKRKAQIDERAKQNENRDFWDWLSDIDSSHDVGIGQYLNTSAQREEEDRYNDLILKLNAIYNSKKYSEDVSKYGIDPSSMTYDQLMEARNNANGTKRTFIDDYINSVGESNLQTKRAVEWYASLPKDEKAKLDGIWENAQNSALAVIDRLMTGAQNATHFFKFRESDLIKTNAMRSELLKNGYSEEDADRIADLYSRRYNASQNAIEQARAKVRGDLHPVASQVSDAIGKVRNSADNLGRPLAMWLGEYISGKPVDVNNAVLRQDRAYETARNAAMNSSGWNSVESKAKGLFGDEAGARVTGWMKSAVSSGLDDLARNSTVGKVAKVLGAEADVISKLVSVVAASNAALTEFRQNVESGKNTDEAFSRAALTGFIEFMTEMVGGEFVWNNILRTDSKGLMKIVTTVAKNALAEGTEEVMGNAAQRALNGLTADNLKATFESINNGNGVVKSFFDNTGWRQDVKAYTDQGLSLDSAMTRALGDWISEDVDAFMSAFLSAGLSSGGTMVITRAQTNSSKKVIGDMVNSLTHDGLLKMVRSVEAKLKNGESDGKPYTKEAAADDVERVRGALVNARENVVQAMTGDESTAEDRAFAEKEAEKINRAIGQVEELSSAIRNDRTAEIPQVAASIEASIREETEREAEEARTKSKRERAISDFVRGLVYGGTRMAQIDQDLTAEIRRLDADAKSGVEGAQKKLDFANEALAYLRRYAGKEVERDGLKSIGKSLDLLGHGKDRSVTIQYDFTWKDDQRNASYDRATNTVTLNPYSRMTQNHVRFVLGHELLHALRADGERGQAIVDSAWNTIQSLMESGQIRRDDENYNMDVLTKLYEGDVRSYLNGEEGRAEVASYVKQGMTEEAARAKAAEQYLKEEAVANFFGDASFWGLDKNGNPVDRRTLMWSENDTEQQRREKAEQLKSLSPLFDVNAVLSDLTQSKARRVLSDFVRTIRNFARSIVGAKPVEAKRFDTLADAYEAVLKRFDAKPVNNTANTENASEAAQGAATEGVERNSRSVAGETPSRNYNIPDNYAAFVRNTKAGFADKLVDGEKTVETRSARTLDKFIGKWMPVLKTESGEVIGRVFVDDVIKYDDKDDFDADYNRHLVPASGNTYSWDGNGERYGYVITGHERFDDPIKLDEYANKYGRIAKDMTPVSISDDGADVDLGSSDASPSERYSISSLFNAADMGVDNPDGVYVAMDKNGKRVNNVTKDMIRTSRLGALIHLATEKNEYRNAVISSEEEEEQLGACADLMNMILKAQDGELVWKFVGAAMFSAYKSNADAQYSTTIDFSTVCRKTEEMIEAMSRAMMERGRGLSVDEVTRLQKKIIEEHGLVPCPVCYVFSRWAGIGGVLNNILRFQNKYGHAYDDASKLQSAIDELKAVSKTKKQLRAYLKASKDEEYLALTSEVEAKRADKKKLKERRKTLAKLEQTDAVKAEIKEIDDYLKAADYVIEEDTKTIKNLESSSPEISWLENVRSNPEYWEKGNVPSNVLFNIADGATFAKEYPVAWQYRTTRGPSAGKAILPYSDMRLGDMILGTKGNSAQGNNTFAEINDGKLNKAQKSAFDKALMRTKAQNLIGGQRYQSTSDFRYDYGLDYFMAFLESQALGSTLQTYTKIIEFAEMVAMMGGDVNISVMPLEKGYADGRLLFSSVTGVDFNTALDVTEKYDSAQMILVGINDKHIELALDDSEETLGVYIGFVIPYHASGASINRFISELVRNLDEHYDEGNYKDYSPVQNDAVVSNAREHIVKRDLRTKLLTRHEKQEKEDGSKKRVSVNGFSDEEKKILSAKSKDISGMSFDELRDIEMRALNGDKDAVREYESWSAGVLGDIYNKMWVDESNVDTYGVELSTKQAEHIMPHEYWNKSANRSRAFENGFIFRSYCHSLGLAPRFTGITSSNTKLDYGDFSKFPGYWKLLIDRPMYDLKGNYRDQNKINVSGISAEMFTPKYGEERWGDKKVQEPSVERARRAADAFLAEESERFSRSLTPEQRKLLDAERRVERLKEEKEFFRALTQKGRKAALSPRDADRIVREIQESFDVKDERIRAALGIVDKLYNKKLAGEERKNAEQTLKSTVESIVRDAYDAETEDGDTLAEWVQKAISDNVDGMISAMYAKYAKYGDSALPQQYMARIRQIEADAERDARAYQKRIADLESQARAKAMRGSATEMLDAARKNARYIWSAAKNPTGKKFVPQNARGAMERLANWIDSITVRGGNLKVDGMKVEGDALPSAPVRGDIAVIEKVYGSEYAELADALLNNIDYYAKYQSGADYQRERNAEKSEWIAKSTYKLSQLLRSAVANQNRVWLDGKRRDTETIGGDMIDALNERRGADERFTSVKDKTFGEKAKESASKLLHFWKTNPGLAVTDAYTFLHRIGRRGDDLFDTLRYAQETQTLRNQEFVDAMLTKLKGIELWKYGDEKWDKYTVTFKDASGREVTVPRSVAMSVAALWRRMQGREHLENGGFVYDRDGKRSDPIRVGEKSVKAIEDALTEDDKKVMNTMLSFMQDECTKWGNEATMRRYGFERFTTDNYFRIDVDKFALPANTDKSFSGQPKIENTSFAKPTSDGAGAPVVAGDFIRSVIHHVNGMATYSSYLNEEGTVNQLLSTKGLRETMQRVLGNGSVKYVEDLMTALKSQTRNEEDALEKLWSMGAAYYKTAAVAYNLSTALKQPISYTRAAAVMDTKYLARGMKAVTSSEGRNRALGEMQEFSGTAVKKLNGYSDTGMARDTAMLIGAKKETVRQKIVEFGMRGAEFGDRITWEALWTACREETRDRNPDLTPAELMEATAKRFSNVVAQTQVTNSPLDTAPILRSNSVLTRNLFAFWNEPLKTYNLLMRAYDNIVQAKDGAAAKRAILDALRRPIASVAAGMVLEAAVSAIFRSLRDDRDDDMDDPETWKKLISLWGGEMVNNVLGVLPYVDQFAEVIRNAVNGYSNTDMGLEVITDILDAAKALADSDGEKAKTQFSRIRALTEAVATAFGIPAKNALRTIKTIASTALNFGGNIKAQYNFQKIFYNPKNATAREKYGFADLLTKAYIEGDEEAYRYIRDDMIQMGLSPASITKSIVKNAKPDDVDGSSSSLTAYKPGSDGWYLAMGAVYDRATGAPRGLEEEVTRLYEATGDSGVLPGFAPDSFTVDGKEVKIEGEAYTEFSASYAKRLYEVQTVIRNTAGYRAASDEQKAWWLEKAETVVGAILKHGIDSDYNVTSQGKWIADYLNASDADIAKYIVENTAKKSGDSSSGGSAQVVLTPTSTEFSQIGYDPSTGTLAVTFRDSGTTYTYSDVPSSVWSGMKGASSVGKYYNANVKGKYKSEKAG